MTVVQRGAQRAEVTKQGSFPLLSQASCVSGRIGLLEDQEPDGKQELAESSFPSGAWERVLRL